MDHYVDGPVVADSVLTKIESFAQTAHPAAGAVHRALKFLAMPDGIDIGSSATHSMIDMLAAGGVLTSDEGSKLKALSLGKRSRSDILFDTIVTEQDLIAAGVV